MVCNISHFYRQLFRFPLQALTHYSQVSCILRQQIVFGGRIVNLSAETAAPKALGAEKAEILHATGHTNGTLPLEEPLWILATKHSKVIAPVYLKCSNAYQYIYIYTYIHIYTCPNHSSHT